MALPTAHPFTPRDGDDPRCRWCYGPWDDPGHEPCKHERHNGLDPRICSDCGAPLDPEPEPYSRAVSVRAAYAFGDWPPAP